MAYYCDKNSKKPIKNANATVARACQIPDLNVFFGVAKSDRDMPETKFFTPYVDTPAAAALRTILDDGVRALTAKQRIDWARFLLSFGVRTPEVLREMGPAETAKAFELVKANAKGTSEASGAIATRSRRPPYPVLLLIIIFSTHSNFVCPGANKFGYRRNCASFLTSLKRGCLIFGQESHGRHEQGSD